MKLDGIPESFSVAALWMELVIIPIKHSSFIHLSCSILNKKVIHIGPNYVKCQNNDANHVALIAKMSQLCKVVLML